MRRPGGRGDRRGFALLLVLSVLALVAALAVEFHTAARADRRLAANARAAVRARWAARAGLAQAMDLLHDAYAVNVRGFALAASGDTLLPPIEFEQPGVSVRVLVLDARARLHLNHARPEDLARLLDALGVARTQALATADAMLDWRDGDDLHRARGAESREYLALRPARRPKNAPFDAVDEIGSVLGMTPALHERLAPHLTIAGDGRVNVNSAPAPVLLTIPGFDDAAVATVLRRRARAPYHGFFDLLAALPGASRARISADIGPTLDRVAFGPREVEIVVEATAHGAPIVARLRATVLLAGGSSVSLLHAAER